MTTTPPKLTDERIHEIVREAAKGSALRPVGSTPTSVRIARAIESEVRTAIAAAGGGVPHDALIQARDMLESWSSYVPPYFAEKHGLKDDFATLDKWIASSPQPEAAPQWVPCKCFDETSRRLCINKDRCSRAEAYAESPPPEAAPAVAQVPLEWRDWVEGVRDDILYPLAHRENDELSHIAEGLGQRIPNLLEMSAPEAPPDGRETNACTYPDCTGKQPPDGACCKIAAPEAPAVAQVPHHYRKKPVVIEAHQWDGTESGIQRIKAHFPALQTLAKTGHLRRDEVTHWRIGTLEGGHEVSKGDWIIKGIKGEFYPCKPDIFDATYEAAPEAPAQAEPDRWCPDVCPITGLRFFMWIEHHKTGRMVPTYGGPYDSYTIPVRDDDGSYIRERYDHDRGSWLVDEVEDVGIQIVSDQAFVYDEERPLVTESAQAAPSAGEVERTPQDYAIEHAEYMAQSAEFLIAAVNDLAKAEIERDDGQAEESDVRAAQETLSEALTSMHSGIHEFRKRRDRAAPSHKEPKP